MDKLNLYRSILQGFLAEYAKDVVAGQAPGQVVFDHKNDHYLYINVGWQSESFYYHVSFHFDIIDGKIWIQQNNTEILIADELVQRGIAPADIILGCQPIYAREHSNFSVA